MGMCRKKLINKVTMWSSSPPKWSITIIFCLSKNKRHRSVKLVVVLSVDLHPLFRLYTTTHRGDQLAKGWLAVRSAALNWPSQIGLLKGSCHKGCQHLFIFPYSEYQQRYVRKHSGGCGHLIIRHSTHGHSTDPPDRSQPMLYKDLSGSQNHLPSDDPSFLGQFETWIFRLRSFNY